MTDSELKKLSRVELLEMLIDLSKENESLRHEIETLDKKLKDKNIKISQSGSIAEACLKLNDIFEAAQASAEQYLENVHNQERICESMQTDAEKRAKDIINEANDQAASIVATAQQKADSLLKEAKNKTEAYWDAVSQRISAFYKENQDLTALLK